MKTLLDLNRVMIFGHLRPMFGIKHRGKILSLGLITIMIFI